MNNFLIGIDGGGTKTRGVLWNENNEIVHEYIGGFSNFIADPIVAKKNLEDTIDQLHKKALGKVTIVIGLSGISGIKNREKYSKELEKKYQAKIHIIDDALLGLEALFKGDEIPAVIIISGTGSNLYGVSKEKFYTIGGFGHILGDNGSSYHLVIEAFKHVINNYEINNSLDDFSQSLFKAIKINEVSDLKKVVYQNTKSEISKYSIIIDDLANQNNKVAISLLKNEANYLAKQFENIVNKMEVSSEEIKVGLIGSFINKSKTVKTHFMNLMKNKNVKIVENLEPIYGAIYFAKKVRNNNEKNI